MCRKRDTSKVWGSHVAYVSGDPMSAILDTGANEPERQVHLQNKGTSESVLPI